MVRRFPRLRSDGAPVGVEDVSLYRAWVSGDYGRWQLDELAVAKGRRMSPLPGYEKAQEGTTALLAEDSIY